MGVDNRANIKPLDQFPDDERELALVRLELFQAKRREELKTLLTKEGLDKLEDLEAEWERRMLYGEKDE